MVLKGWWVLLHIGTKKRPLDNGLELRYELSGFFTLGILHIVNLLLFC